MDKLPIVIIGAGPAGLAAAMQLKRQGINPLVFERKQVGGLLLNANLVENYPGFVNGIKGTDLVSLFEEQAQRLGVVIEQEEVLSARFNSNYFRIVTNKRELQAQILIAGSGTKPIKLTCFLEPKRLEERIHYEVFPLIDERNKEILIIGAGDAAFDYALNLSRLNKIIILNKGSKIKALPLLLERVQRNSAISYLPDSEVTGILESKNGRLLVMVKRDGLVFECDHLLAAIGREPETQV